MPFPVSKTTSTVHVLLLLLASSFLLRIFSGHLSSMSEFEYQILWSGR